MSAGDWIVIGVYFAVVLGIAFRVSPGQRTTRDYFLGGKSVPWWAATLSIIATETSAVTYIGTPAKAYAGDWSFLQMVLGFACGRLFLAFFFVPAFHRHEIITVYGYLERRFGDATRIIAASLFLVGRILGSGVRLFAGCLALTAATGLSLERSVLVMGVVGTIYTLAGGIRAVIWTDVLLGITFMAGAAIAAVSLVSGLGGFSAMLEHPLLPGKTQVFHFAWYQGGESSFIAGVLGNESSFIAGLAGGFALTLATHGTDQDIAQRILTCRDSKGGMLSLIGSAVIIVPLMALFLAVGTLLYLFYADRGALDALPRDTNHIFPKYIVEELPTGARGLVMAGLLAAALSSFTSVLNALASTIIADFYRPLRTRLRAVASEAHFVSASRWATLICGVVLMFAALAFQGSDQSVLVIALQVLTYFYGALLGAFLLGIFTRRGTSASVVPGMLLGVATVLLLQLRAFLEKPALAPEMGRRLVEAMPDGIAAALSAWIPLVAWPWWIIAGAVVTLAVGALGSPRGPAEESVEIAAGRHGAALR